MTGIGTMARTFALLALTAAGLIGGLVLTAAGRDDLATWVWAVPTIVVGVRLVWSIVRDLLAGEAGVDIIAVLAIGGALALGETFAAAVIAVMLATGEALETYAEGRAHRELTALLGRAPQTVSRYRNGGLETVSIGDVVPGDRLLVRPGEIVPVDGLVRDHPAVLDESALTGESRLVTHEDGETVSSGVVNAGRSFDLMAIATADASTYAGIVRLVEEAERAKAPFVRLADRYALMFVPAALAMAGLAWLISGDPVRALAVLVVATPCPLLLAAPIAIVAGISRAARRGIIVKGGGPLETLARSRVLLFDKTGTLTAGRPRLASIESVGRDPDDLLRLGAALEQASPHVLAAALVHAAHKRDLVLSLPTDVIEAHGGGVSGTVEGSAVAVGSAAFVSPDGELPVWARELRRRATLEGATNVFIRIDGEIAGAFVLDDPIRSDTPRAVRGLRRAGFTRIIMVTGDHHSVAELVGAAIGLDGVLADRAPADKVDAVRMERDVANGPLVMVGDGINDAPALAVADVGVAMGARGATASSEAADIVITVDRLDRLAEAVRIARHSRSIAVQSVVAGMGMSLIAMVVAAFGFLPVVAGALLQEVIDVAVILNALRALRGGLERPIRVPGWADTGIRLTAEHRTLAPGIARLRIVADHLDAMDPHEAREALLGIRTFLVETLVPHEEEEDREIYPILARAIGTDDATSALHRTHTEIFHLIRLYGRIVDEIGTDGPTADDRTDLQRALYGLDAILRLHMAQEEELYASIDAEASAALKPSAA
ncbi:MAG: heavy metal translocating P-type ATPase [Chloroflexota bacterium]|jgi:heavy metal translocating P-type ATPase|nr:heavy metal translocating P-type ATPase [Chloroflexota bacterium]